MAYNLQKISTLSPGLAKEYDSTSAYELGEYVLYLNAYWKCTTAISSPGESWDESHWEKDEEPLEHFAKDYATIDYVDSLVYSPIVVSNFKLGTAIIAMGQTVNSVTLSWATSGAKAVKGYAYGPGLPEADFDSFDSDVTYVPGDTVKNGSTNYYCITEHTGEWVAAHFKSFSNNHIRLLTDTELKNKTFSVTGSFGKSEYDTTQKWGIVLFDKGSPDVAPAYTAPTAATLTICNYIYYGKSAMPGTGGEVNLAFLQAMAGTSGKKLQNSRVTSFSPNASGTGEYAWYALPARLGQCAFIMGGVPAAFGTVLASGIPDVQGGTVYTISLSNEHGATSENYYVYRSFYDATVTGVVQVTAKA